jgi:hypothetical protein
MPPACLGVGRRAGRKPSHPASPGSIGGALGFFLRWASGAGGLWALDIRFLGFAFEGFFEARTTMMVVCLMASNIVG